MSSITTRAGKGTPLTHTEVDDNFTNLNADKLEASNNLSDVSSASAARTNLGLGTAATTASTDYATAAQGSLADSALQSGDNVSALTNDAGYTTNVGDITGVTAGTDITGGGTSGTVTINHADTSTLSGTYGSTSNGTKIDNITVDARGHVTAITTGATGDITGVTAGSNLTGGGTSGTVTLNVSSSPTFSGTVTASSYAGDGSNLTGISAGPAAWVNFNGTGTVAIRDDGNVSSITDNGAGDYSVNFSTALTTANYVTSAHTNGVSTAYELNSQTAIYNSANGGADPTTSVFRLITGHSTNATTKQDRSFIHFMAVL